jgi:hypothetical protein
MAKTKLDIMKMLGIRKAAKKSAPTKNFQYKFFRKSIRLKLVK